MGSGSSCGQVCYGRMASLSHVLYKYLVLVSPKSEILSGIEISGFRQISAFLQLNLPPSKTPGSSVPSAFQSLPLQWCWHVLAAGVPLQALCLSGQVSLSAWATAPLQTAGSKLTKGNLISAALLAFPVEVLAAWGEGCLATGKRGPSGLKTILKAWVHVCCMQKETFSYHFVFSSRVNLVVNFGNN